MGVRNTYMRLDTKQALKQEKARKLGTVNNPPKNYPSRNQFASTMNSAK